MKADSGPEAAGLARRALDGLDVHLTPEMLASVRLLVTELVTNSVRHAELEDDDKVALNVRVSEESVRVEVGDPGGGFEPTARKGELDLEGGWGLYLVDRLADRWGVANEAGTMVWLEMDLQPLGATA
ncbi:MAG: ATP-binding protein [Thermoleophilaceae bacterium]|nr:ATP-binding protein [Thermoleophilaceae bacterium]